MEAFSDIQPLIPLEHPSRHRIQCDDDLQVRSFLRSNDSGMHCGPTHDAEPAPGEARMASGLSNFDECVEEDQRCVDGQAKIRLFERLDSLACVAPPESATWTDQEICDFFSFGELSPSSGSYS